MTRTKLRNTPQTDAHDDEGHAEDAVQVRAADAKGVASDDDEGPSTASKRKRDDADDDHDKQSEDDGIPRAVIDEDEDDDDDVGPMPALPDAEGDAAQRKKKARVLKHEHLYLKNLPEGDMYEKSLMHRDIVNFVQVTPFTDFLITTSVDGHVKFWKKTERGVEFVKHYRAHLGAVVAVATSWDGLLFATAGADKAVKVFDVVNFGE
ncbi:hypothetical protein HDV05_000392 [Chytridiales sp. JEL 0842]|nr:hypothetical protein HDV05_000392 [Chytridiales sp. JEL 0842]